MTQDQNKFESIRLVKELETRKSKFKPVIEKIFNSSETLLNNRIPVVFPDYTLHDINHSIRIMEYMYDLIDDISKINEFEITLLIYSAILHDIGMAVSDDDIKNIKADNYPLSEIKFSAIKKYYNDNEALSLEEFVRKIHADRSVHYILTEINADLYIPDFPSLDFSKELALICQSHTKDFEWIKRNLRSNGKFKGDYDYNMQYTACLLRLGDILDIDSNRTPYNLFKAIAPKGISSDEWKQHYTIHNNKKIIFNEKTGLKKIVFHGECSYASIHRKILKYIDWVNRELNDSMALSTEMNDIYRINFQNNIEANITPNGYSFSDYKMTLDFKAISALLMGEKIYGDKKLGLRELIQNAIDTCKTREEFEKANFELGNDEYIPRIKIIIDESKNQVIIKDNGMGMSIDIIKKYFLNIGVSYYNSPDFALKDFQYRPIGNFGIGFLSCFMLSDSC